MSVEFSVTVPAADSWTFVFFSSSLWSVRFPGILLSLSLERTPDAVGSCDSFGMKPSEIHLHFSRNWKGLFFFFPCCFVSCALAQLSAQCRLTAVKRKQKRGDFLQRDRNPPTGRGELGSFIIPVRFNYGWSTLRADWNAAEMQMSSVCVFITRSLTFCRTYTALWSGGLEQRNDWRHNYHFIDVWEKRRGKKKGNNSLKRLEISSHC